MEIQRGYDPQIAEIPYKLKNEFTLAGTVQLPWVNSAISSGTIGVLAPIPKHPGVLSYSSHASNANSGYCFITEGSTFLLGGGEKTTIIFKTPASLTGVTRRMGFHDSASVSAPTDGVYIKMDADTLTGQTINNTTGSTTATNYTVSTATWYRAVIELNADATLAIFTLYADDSTTVLWQDTLATNIPTATGRNVGHGDVCTLASPSGATAIGAIDYMDIVLPNARRVV